MLRKFRRWLIGERLEGERTILQKLHVLLDFLAYWIRRIFTDRYVLQLEARVAQLEAQNAAHINTIFGLRGLPPLPATESSAFTKAPRVMDSQPVMRPKVEPVIPRRAGIRDRATQVMNDAKAEANEVTERIANALKHEIETAENRYRAKRGEGMAIPAGASAPVQVSEPIVEAPEEGNDAER